MSNFETLLDSDEPTLAVVVPHPIDEAEVEAMQGKVDVVEIRADLFPNHDRDAIHEQIAAFHGRLPVLFTLRDADERGLWSGSEVERLNFYSEFFGEVDAIDSEIHSPGVDAVMAHAHDQRVSTIASWHDFHSPPIYSELNKAYEQGLQLGASFVKLAIGMRGIDDFREVSHFTVEHSNEELIVVGMEDYGPLSRITLPYLGSCMTYASLPGEAVAPGQMDYHKTRELLDRFKPAQD